MAITQDPGLGDKLFQLAQGIIATEQKNQALIQREEQIQEQKKRDAAALQSQKIELDAKQRTIDLQEKQFELRAGAAPGVEAKRTAETNLAIERTRQLQAGVSPGGPGGLTANKRVDISQRIVNQAIAVETGQFISQWNADNDTGINPAQGPTQIEAERRRLRKLVLDFQNNPRAVIAQDFAKSKGRSGFEIDEMQRQLAALDKLVLSEEWASLVTRLRDDGPAAETRQQVKNRFFGEFGAQIDAQAEPTPIAAFRYGSADKETIDSGWQLFDEGNVDVLADLVVESGTLTRERQTQLKQELRQRRPVDPGPEQDEFDKQARRLIEVIRTRGTQ